MADLIAAIIATVCLIAVLAAGYLQRRPDGDEAWMGVEDLFPVRDERAENLETIDAALATATESTVRDALLDVRLQAMREDAA